jgi:hypothetical protein
MIYMKFYIFKKKEVKKSKHGYTYDKLNIKCNKLLFIEKEEDVKKDDKSILIVYIKIQI